MQEVGVCASYSGVRVSQGVGNKNNLGASCLLIEEPMKPGPPGSWSGPRRAEAHPLVLSGNSMSWDERHGKIPRLVYDSDPLWEANLGGRDPVRCPGQRPIPRLVGGEGLGPSFHPR